MTSPWPKTLAEKLRKPAWAIFLFTLPVTSFPYFPPIIGGGALVRPLSIYPLLLLLFLTTLPTLLRKPLPKTLLPLLVFVLFALTSSLLSLLRGIEPAHDIPVMDRILRTVVTLALGCAFYFTVALTPRSLEDLRFSLRWIYAGFIAALAWGSLQAIYIVASWQSWYRLMNKLQRLISSRRLMQNRISGLTYEPNWFGEQLTFLLLPWLVASVLSGYTVFRWRRGWLTVEAILLSWVVLIVPFTYSRAGVVNLIIVSVAGLLLFRLRPGQKTAASNATKKHVIKRLVEIILVLIGIGGLVFSVGAKNEFFARIWDYWKKKEVSLSGYMKYLGFEARFTYSGTAFRIFETYPLMGVGLGNYAYYFEEMLPDSPLAYTPEVLRVITPEEGRNRLITAKNFYFRLLAETGIMGFSAFIAFSVAILGNCLALIVSPYQKPGFWGKAGLLGFIAFLFSALSFDSFALPNMWVVFGLITAAAWVFRQPSLMLQEIHLAEDFTLEYM